MWGDRVHEGFPCRGSRPRSLRQLRFGRGGNWLTPFRTRSGHMRRGAEQPRETDSPPGRRRSAAPVPVRERFGLRVADAIRGTRKRSRHSQTDRSLCAPIGSYDPPGGAVTSSASLPVHCLASSGVVTSTLSFSWSRGRSVEFSPLEQAGHTSKISNSR